MTRDLRLMKRAEEERRRLSDEIIRAQAAMLAELSTPLIPISDQVVVMPLIGTVDEARAGHVLETLLSGVTARGAKVAILDITGAATVDVAVAEALLRAARAVRLLGAEVVLTGIRPEVAQALIGLDVDLGDRLGVAAPRPPSGQIALRSSSSPPPLASPASRVCW